MQWVLTPESQLSPTLPALARKAGIGQQDVDSPRGSFDGAGGRRGAQGRPTRCRQRRDDIELPKVLVEVSADECRHRSSGFDVGQCFSDHGGGLLWPFWNRGTGNR
eukprot:5185588-Heterocapsa_arctica.AAC.1